MTSRLLKSPFLFSLRNSGAKYVANKSHGDIRFFQFALAIHWQTTVEDSAETFVSAMALAYLKILSQHYLFYRRAHPMLEKLGTKNLVVCENQGKQHKLRVRVMKKKCMGECKKDKRLTDKQVLTKDFT